jgi:predicted nucleic acid-binding protein
LLESEEAAAIALVRAHEDKSYSLCDAMSFVVMERMKITDAIAFDRHFAEYGRFALI